MQDSFHDQLSSSESKILARFLRGGSEWQQDCCDDDPCICIKLDEVLLALKYTVQLLKTQGGILAQRLTHGTLRD
jgi:hypothetical protein